MQTPRNSTLHTTWSDLSNWDHKPKKQFVNGCLHRKPDVPPDYKDARKRDHCGKSGKNTPAWACLTSQEKQFSEEYVRVGTRKSFAPARVFGHHAKATEPIEVQRIRSEVVSTAGEKETTSVSVFLQVFDLEVGATIGHDNSVGMGQELPGRHETHDGAHIEEP